MPSPAFSAPPLAPYTPVNASALAKRTTLALVGIAFLIALIGGAGFFVINGQIQQELAIQTDRDSQVGSAKQIASREAKAHSDFDAINSQLKYIEQPTDVKSYVPTLLPQIESMAKSYNLQVTVITPGAITTVGPAPGGTSAGPMGASPSSASDSSAPPPVPATYETMPLTINITGPYRQVMKYIYNLTRFPKVLSVKEISLHPSSGSGAAGVASETNVGANLQMVAYVFQPSTTASAAAPTSTTGTAATATGSTAATPTATPAQPATSVPIPVSRPMHGAMAPLATQPLPIPASLKALSTAHSGTATASQVKSHN